MISTARHVDERKVSSLMSRQNLNTQHAGIYECVDDRDSLNYDRIEVVVVTHALDKCKLQKVGSCSIKKLHYFLMSINEIYRLGNLSF